jgi:quercetin dioxygenase-like cupin family protein
MDTPEDTVGEVVDVRPLRSALGAAPTQTLVRAGGVEVIRLVVPKGRAISDQANGETIVHCLEGRVSLTAFGKRQNLEAGQLLHLPTGEPYTVTGMGDACLLLTLLPTGR